MICRNDSDKIDWSNLSENKNAVHILEKNLDKVSWESLAKCNENSRAIELLEQNFSNEQFWNERDDSLWHELIFNPNPKALQLIDKYNDLLNSEDRDGFWEELSAWDDDLAVKILENNIDYIFWPALCLNRNRNALKIIENNLDKFPLGWLASSPHPTAMQILEKNLDKACNHEEYDQKEFWRRLSRNENAIHILEKNLDKTCWNELSSNENAIHILEKNLDKVCWYNITYNHNALHIIFDYDYEYMKVSNCKLFKEIVEYVFNPVRLLRISETYDMDMEEYLNVL